MAAPAAKKGPIDPNDVQDWMNLINDLVKSGDIAKPAPADARPWHNQIFGCFNPIDKCTLMQVQYIWPLINMSVAGLVAWCIPCVSFGKTHHMTRKNANLEGYSPINLSVRFDWSTWHQTTSYLYLHLH
jgi:hypothetical protein